MRKERREINIVAVLQLSNGKLQLVVERRMGDDGREGKKTEVEGGRVRVLKYRTGTGELWGWGTEVER